MRLNDPRLWAAAAAAALPSLLAWNVSPSPTFLNQALALALWGAFLALSAPAAPGRGPWPLWAALGAVALAAAWSWGPGVLPSTLALSAQILMELDMPTLRGNEDRILLEEPGRHPDSPSLPFVQSRLNPEHARWLQTLPLTAVVQEDFCLCHGSPEKDTEYLLREVTALGPRVLSSQEVEAKLKMVVQSIILCGHDHLPALVRFPTAVMSSIRGASDCRPTATTCPSRMPWRQDRRTPAMPWSDAAVRD